MGHVSQGSRGIAGLQTHAEAPEERGSVAAYAVRLVMGRASASPLFFGQSRWHLIVWTVEQILTVGFQMFAER